MSYTDPTVDLSTPTSSSPANTLHTLIIEAKRVFKERWEDLTGADADVDPNVPTKYGPNISINSAQVRQTTPYNNGTCTTTKTLSFDNGNMQYGAVSGVCVFSFSNVRAGATMTLRLSSATQASFDGSVKWAGGVEPTPSGLMVYQFMSYDGTEVIGFAPGQNVS